MKIYILYSYEGYVIGLFSTLEKAETAKKDGDYISACWLDDFT